MEWSTIGSRIIYLVIVWVAITGAYYISKECVLWIRLKSDKKPNIIGAIVAFVISPAIAWIISFIISHNRIDPYTIALTVIITIAAYYGLYKGYEEDNKLSLEQKVIKRKQKQVETLDRMINPET